MEPVKPRPRVLVIRGGAVGDFILTLPAIRLLRQSIPDCHLEVMGYPGIISLAVKAGLADSTRNLEHRAMALLFARGAEPDPALAEHLRSFNLVVSYLFDPDGILRANLEKCGVKTLLECPHLVVPDAGHAALQLARPLERLAMFPEEPEWRAPFFASPPPATTAAPRLAIHPGSGSLRKNWPLPLWLDVARALQSRLPGLEIAWITGEAEEERGLTAQLPPAAPGTLRWHGLPLTDLADQLATCACFLGHDSGVPHLAAACGVPSLLLFGPTDPAVWAPPQAGVQVLRAPQGDLSQLPPELVLETALHKLAALGILA